MIRYVVVVSASVGLILLASVVVGRLIRSRRRGLSIRMQVFLALATIIGCFALGLGVLVVERVESRARRLALDAAEDEARIIAALLGAELNRKDQRVVALVADLFHNESSADFRAKAGKKSLALDSRKRNQKAKNILSELGVEVLNLQGELLFPPQAESRALEEGSVFYDASLFQKGVQVARVRVVKPTIVIETMLADFAPSVLILSLILGASAAFAASLIGRAIALPVEELRRYSFDVSRGERAAPPALSWGREVAHLVSSIEVMRKRLEGRPFVETFAADLSHELKNPVAAIRASAEVLAEGALEERFEAKRFVARIQEAAKRIELLLEELLSLAQIEARGVEKFARVNLGDLVQEVEKELEGGLSLDLPESALWVQGERLWLKRALLNLGRNAVLHSQKQALLIGDISPDGRDEQTSAAQLKVVLKSNEIVFLFSNTGQIPEHLQSTLFRRFVTTRGDRGGTGLGLAIARAVAEAHGGTLSLSASGPPKVQFELNLPLERSEASFI